MLYIDSRLMEGAAVCPTQRRGVRRRRTNAAKHAVTSARAWVRGTLAGANRRLPDIVIIGGQRCGTTSLFRYLSGHPDVVEPMSKELNYLSFHFGRGDGWYRGHFPRTTAGQRTLEASPFYCVDPVVPARAARLLPQAHFIALLRNPTERAYSHYLHNLEHGLENLSFPEALAAEPERLKRARALGVDGRPGLRLMRAASYFHRREYANQLQGWFETFPREQIVVIRSRTCSTHRRGPTGTSSTG